MKVTIDKDVCIGCGFCASVCPEVFRVQEDIEKATVYGEVNNDNISAVEDAMEGCPVRAISED